MNPLFLMSLLCAEDCLTEIGSIPASYHDICVGDVLRDFGFKQVIWLRCDYEFTDILDPDEWITARDNGDVGISPEGSITINTPTQPTFVIDGCLREKAGQATIPIDYFTYQTADDLSDFDYWKTINSNAASYRIMLVDCNGIFWVSDNFKAAILLGAPAMVAGESPGLEFSITQLPIPQPGAEPTYQIWSMQFQIKISSVPCVSYLPGVLTALNSAASS